MKYDSLNSFIKNYMENDKTGTAVMLTAPWGFGKSYYIKNTLIPFLDNSGYKCVVVSLYGLRSVREISKQIYLSIRTIRFLKRDGHKSEALSTSKAVGKTILNAFAPKVGLDLANYDENAFQEVYESIDLTGKLVVLEDVERTEIDIVSVLGYVNNLTEHDNVRVLLVTNEDELIKIEKKTNLKIAYSDATEIYLKFKEKTIGDTVSLSEDQSDAISNILSDYFNISNDYSAQEIFSQFGTINLRTLKYACQKSNELIEYVNKVEFDSTEYLQQFRKNIFFGVLRQAILLSKNFDQACKWAGGKYYLEEEEKTQIRYSNATSQVYLLFKFCFDYLISHDEPSREQVKETYKAYCTFCLYETNQTVGDPDLSILKSYYICTEEEVKGAVANIEKRLENENDIPFKAYGDLSRILIHIKHELGISVENSKKSLVKNLKGKSSVVDADAMFIFNVSEKDSDKQREYIELKEAMISSLNEYDEAAPFFIDYKPEHIRDLELKIYHRNTEEDFVSKLDIEKLKGMIVNSTAKGLDDLRGLFFAAYRKGLYGGKSVFYPISDKDRNVMTELIRFINDNDFGCFDRVQMLQLYTLRDNLSEMINAGVENEKS